MVRRDSTVWGLGYQQFQAVYVVRGLFEHGPGGDLRLGVRGVFGRIDGNPARGDPVNPFQTKQRKYILWQICIVRSEEHMNKMLDGKLVVMSDAEVTALRAEVVTVDTPQPVITQDDLQEFVSAVIASLNLKNLKIIGKLKKA